MKFRSPNTVRGQPGNITKCSESTDEGILGSLHVTGQLSLNLTLRPRLVFPVIYGTYVLIMNVENYYRRDLLYAYMGKI